MPFEKRHLFSSLHRRWSREKNERLPYYQYAALDPNHIRLLRLAPGHGKALQCTIETHSLDQYPSFCALSYTWGAACRSDAQLDNRLADQSKYIICGDNCILPITQNLSDACYQLRDSEPGQYLWIDAICINQQDRVEKAHQIMKMKEIYDRASKVIVWLGLPCALLQDFLWVTEILYPKLVTIWKTDQSLLFHSTSFHGVSDKVGLGPQDLLEKLRAFYYFLDNRRWFSRIWTLQESADITKAHILCGASHISLNDAMGVALLIDHGSWHNELQLHDFWNGQPPIESPSLPARREIYLSVQSFKDERAASSLNAQVEFNFGAVTEEEKGISWLAMVLKLARRFKSTDERDKIFALIGFLQPCLSDMARKSIGPNYFLTVEDVFINFAKVGLTEVPRITLLSMVDDPSSRTIPNLPSWAPEFSISQSSINSLLITADRIYDSMNCSATVQATRTFEGPIFVCNGAELDSVAHICTATNIQAVQEFRMLEFLQFCCLLPETIIGTDRIEAIWRTWIGNRSRDYEAACDIYPAPQSMAVNFKAMIQELLAVNLVLHGHQPSLLSDIKELLHRLDPLRTSDALPTIQDIETCKAFTERRLQGAEDSESLEYRRLHEKQVSAYGSLVKHITSGRRLFVTQKGFIGMGGSSTTIGDQVVFLCDSLVPLILRHQANTNTFQVVSDCYLYGFMNGEVLEDTWGLKQRIRPLRIS